MDPNGDRRPPDRDTVDSSAPPAATRRLPGTAPGTSSPTRPATGTVGPYRIEGELGRGGMGVVYRAFHPGLKRTVALKVLIAGEDASAEAIARFHREAEAVAKLGHHPNIVPVYDIGSEGHRHYFAMHLVEGRSLDQAIDEGTISPPEAARIAKKIAEALSHAHERGVLHRDVKPANILMARAQADAAKNPKSQIPNPNEIPNLKFQRPLPEGEAETSKGTRKGTEIGSWPLEVGSSAREGGEPMLTDFGLAKDVSAETKVTRTGVTLGTPNYMPPEQAEGRISAIDARSDVYGLGATLYEMLASRPPFEGPTAMEVLRRVVLTDPVSPARANPAVGRDLETICLKCLEKDPARRYGSARELAEDLDRFLSGAPILARPPSLPEKILRRARRNKAAAAALAGLAAALAAGAVGGALYAGSLARERDRSARSDALRRAADEDRAKAERSETEARGAERKAVDRLEKSRRASKILLAANTKLAKTGAELKRAARTPGAARDEVNPIRARLLEAVDRWAASESGDPAGKSAALAVQGWFLHLARRDEAAFQALKASGEADPEVRLNALVECLIWMDRYLGALELPAAKIGPRGLEMGDRPRGSPETGKARERFRVLCASLRESPALDASASESVGGALEGVLSLAEGRTEEAERRLTAALDAPELQWLSQELRLARAIGRYLARDFQKGLADSQVLEEEGPPHAPHLYLRGTLLAAAGIEAETGGGDGRAPLRAAAEALDSALALTPDNSLLWMAKGAVASTLAEAAKNRGEDPSAALAAALEAQQKAFSLDPKAGPALVNVGVASFELADASPGRPAEAERLYVQAAEAAGRVLLDHPDYAEALTLRALALTHLGDLLDRQGRGATEAHEGALR
ncbi:MAG: serine/threonine protein kinase, partial [Planctomycetes bacterium]|nr:serine/threonine protein kinase [Planctomycetota bacterium]